MKLELIGNDMEEQPVFLGLMKCGSGGVVLYADNYNTSSNILRITDDGTLRLMGGVNTDLGFELDDKQCVVMKEPE